MIRCPPLTEELIQYLEALFPNTIPMPFPANESVEAIALSVARRQGARQIIDHLQSQLYNQTKKGSSVLVR